MNTDVKNHSTAFGWVGIIAVAAFSFMWIICCTIDGSWTWGVNTISDFGISATDAASVFTYGCAVFGIALAIYGVGRLQSKAKVGFSVGGILLTIAGVCFALVGVFTCDYHDGDYHKFLAILGAILTCAAIIAITIQNYYDGMIIPVGMTIILVTVAIISCLEFDFAKYEIYCIILGLIWVVIDAACMIGIGLKGGKTQC